ncbi:MAG: hypothetical protein JWN48_4925 [Myxococcaceae bacterium]|nr:hypothetical protein [Myxococcaceae bacterium]
MAVAAYAHSECRVAEQERTSIQLIEERFKARGFSDFTWSLGRSYAPHRSTRWPRILGAQTATVVGPEGQDICTDPWREGGP